MNKFLRDPIYITLKYLYPKLFRIDNILQDQLNYYKSSPDNIIVKKILKFLLNLLIFKFTYNLLYKYLYLIILL
jgi:hypothetical protein